MQQNKRVEKQAIDCILRYVFFGSLIMRMPLVQDDTIETFCTDGRSVKYSSDFAAKLIDAEIKGVYLHELLHAAFGHPWRVGKRNLMVANIAADHVVNLFLNEYSKMLGTKCDFALPKDHFADARFTNMSFEQIYTILMNEGWDKKAQGKQVKYGWFEGAGEDKTEDTAKGMTADGWTGALVRAAHTARAMGQTGACIDRLVGEMTKGSVDWRAITQSFVQEATGSYEYDWCKPNPQYLERDIFFPSLVREEEMRDLVIAIDTSGSVSKELLTQFIGECQNAMETLRPERMVVIQFDHQIQEVTSYERDDVIPTTRLKGGGGTRFEPVFEHIEKNQIDPICLMVFTDLAGSFPKCPPNYPVLWLAYGAENTKTPFGQVAEITL